MMHFDLTEWAEFARGTASEASRTAQQAHLETGCQKCTRNAEFLRSLAAIASSETRWQVPAAEVRCARAIFAFQRPEKISRLPRILAHLVYDSFREPQSAAVRGEQRLSRQALYEAGDFRLDLRLEQERGSVQGSLVGQIENYKDPTQRVASVPVFLSAGKHVVARTVSNEFGEFQLNYPSRTHLLLHVPVLQEHGLRIEVPLQSLLAEQAPEELAAPKTPGLRRGRK